MENSKHCRSGSQRSSSVLHGERIWGLWFRGLCVQGEEQKVSEVDDCEHLEKDCISHENYGFK